MSPVPMVDDVDSVVADVFTLLCLSVLEVFESSFVLPVSNDLKLIIIRTSGAPSMASKHPRRSRKISSTSQRSPTLGSSEDRVCYR